MILINRLPDLPWSEYCAEEIRQESSNLFSQSTVVYQIDNFAVIGFIHLSFLSPPWLWAAFTDMGMRELRELKNLMKQIPQGTITGVSKDSPVALRFARAFGFRKAHDLETEKHFIMRKY